MVATDVAGRGLVKDVTAVVSYGASCAEDYVPASAAPAAPAPRRRRPPRPGRRARRPRARIDAPEGRAGVPSALQQVAGGGRGGEAQRRWR